MRYHWKTEVASLREQYNLSTEDATRLYHLILASARADRVEYPDAKGPYLRWFDRMARRVRSNERVDRHEAILKLISYIERANKGEKTLGAIVDENIVADAKPLVPARVMKSEASRLSEMLGLTKSQAKHLVELIRMHLEGKGVPYHREAGHVIRGFQIFLEANRDQGVENPEQVTLDQFAEIVGKIKAERPSPPPPNPTVNVIVTLEVTDEELVGLVPAWIEEQLAGSKLFKVVRVDRQ